jgi:hypothetical protein
MYPKEKTGTITSPIFLADSRNSNCIQTPDLNNGRTNRTKIINLSPFFLAFFLAFFLPYVIDRLDG